MTYASILGDFFLGGFFSWGIFSFLSSFFFCFCLAVVWLGHRQISPSPAYLRDMPLGLRSVPCLYNPPQQPALLVNARGLPAPQAPRAVSLSFFVHAFGFVHFCCLPSVASTSGGFVWRCPPLFVRPLLFCCLGVCLRWRAPLLFFLIGKKNVRFIFLFKIFFVTLQPI